MRVILRNVSFKQEAMIKTAGAIISGGGEWGMEMAASSMALGGFWYYGTYNESQHTRSVVQIAVILLKRTTRRRTGAQ